MYDVTAFHLSKCVSLPEKVAERKIIVYKSNVDPTEVRATAEKMKTKLFRKFVFMKPKREQVQVISIDKYFEPYIVIEGEYTIDYSKNWTQNIQVDETMQNLSFCGEKIQPISLKDHLETPCKIVTLTGIGRYKHKAKARIIFDLQWHEVGLEQLPLVPFEDQPEKILNKFDQKSGNTPISSKKEVELLKSRLVQRPSKILSIHEELFNVSDRAFIYKPMYKVTVQNLKTKKEASMVIDAITGKTKVCMKQAAAPLNKEQAKKPAEPPSTKTGTEKTSAPTKK